ncbi:uncharacterized protein LOC128558093 [Mercenaria mercenaria]|uniref:uncharacterized protein LOC128558093 n=1 Tax=Mercenaria mercenaria TaxID=6596 RepID=UPI00234E37F8|nr:uncharacterized protein LOC128558093 [Mercenaria mercenaria]
MHAGCRNNKFPNPYKCERRTNRQSTSANYANAEFHKGQDGSIAIENPGYVPSSSSTTDNIDEHPYSSVDPRHVQPVNGGDETLPEVAQIEVTRDTAVLTFDSWMKDMQKAGSDIN